MKKLIVCLIFASTFMVKANDNKNANTESINTEKVSINNVNGSCTVTVTMKDSYGDTFTGTGTAETCSAARKLAYADLSKSVANSIE